MTATPIAHVGILVSDLERAKEHWSKVLGESFSPFVRYRPASWSYRGEFTPGVPGVNELRQTIYLGVNPSIEIQQYVENGTHSKNRGEGGHHIGFQPVADTKLRRKELENLKIRIAGAVKYQDREIIQFTEHDDLDNVSTEWVELSKGHLDLKDDGTDVNRLPDGSGTIFELETIRAINNVRPNSNIKEIIINVRDLVDSLSKWASVTGQTFSKLDSRTPVALSDGEGAKLRLIEATSSDSRIGIIKLVFQCEDLAQKRQNLLNNKVPITLDTLHNILIDGEYLNNVQVEFTDK